MTRHTYHQAVEGEWITVARRGLIHQCCDCAGVHRFDFRFQDGKLQLRVFRDNRKTAAARRKFRFEPDE